MEEFETLLDIETFGEFFLEELEKIKELAEDDPGNRADDEDEEEESEYNDICGGKHYHHFHGDMAGLRKMENYAGRINFTAMGY